MKCDHEDLEQYGITRQGRFSTAVFSETPATEQMAQPLYQKQQRDRDELAAYIASQKP